ncbi:GNAT family N-acetyltransferase [Kaustia mangrovi]|uniref:GNAT family N-acetyltransferase n=1 Tax=Kaustia mangrovi TaxID=2593653 RepID=A0A7S8C4L8_9HYPH|nr:GNAT family N-acetyltransferase [Kaustia mangrovi]QPC43300.1 GNAT family N-acetyltransferase [Kaustia mangrovi]
MASMRIAEAGDVAAIETVARDAYSLYLDRMDRPPGPMLADYAGQVNDGLVHVLESEGAIAGFAVIEPRSDHLFLENVAVAPGWQGRGFGRRLVGFVEEEARRRDLSAIALYTNEVMVENLALYAHLGFEVTHRAVEDGYRRIYMRKDL